MLQDAVYALRFAIRHANMLTSIISEAIAARFCSLTNASANADAKQQQCKCYANANANANASARANENTMPLQPTLNASAKPNAMRLQP